MDIGDAYVVGGLGIAVVFYGEDGSVEADADRLMRTGEDGEVDACVADSSQGRRAGKRIRHQGLHLIARDSGVASGKHLWAVCCVPWKLQVGDEVCDSGEGIGGRSATGCGVGHVGADRIAAVAIAADEKFFLRDLVELTAGV